MSEHFEVLYSESSENVLKPSSAPQGTAATKLSEISLENASFRFLTVKGTLFPQCLHSVPIADSRGPVWYWILFRTCIRREDEPSSSKTMEE